MLEIRRQHIDHAAEDQKILEDIRHRNTEQRLQVKALDERIAHLLRGEFFDQRVDSRDDGYNCPRRQRKHDDHRDCQQQRPQAPQEQTYAFFLTASRLADCARHAAQIDKINRQKRQQRHREHPYEKG